MEGYIFGFQLQARTHAWVCLVPFGIGDGVGAGVVALGGSVIVGFDKALRDRGGDGGDGSRQGADTLHDG